MLGRPCAVACALGLWLGGAAGQEWPALELYGLPYLRDCGESNFVRPIDAFCRKSFRPEELFAGAPQPLIFSVGPLRTIAEGRGALAHVRIEGTLHANVADLWFDAFFTGPALLRATVLERRRGAYEFSARAFDAGVYSLELTLMWENRTFAFSPVLGEQPDVASVIKLRSAENARHRHNAPLCRPLRVVGDTGAPPFRVAEVSVSGPPLPRALPLCAPYGSPRYDAGERADWGRWVNLSHPETRRAFEPLARPAAIAVNGTGGTAKRRLQASAARGCELAWAPSSCAMRRYGAAELDSCVDAGVRLQLVGDSNMRELFKAICAVSAKAKAHWVYQGSTCIMIPFDVSQRRWSNRNNALLASVSGSGNATHCIFTSGAWDLQRQPAGHVFADWAFLLGKLHSVLAARAPVDGPDKRPVVVWRTTVAIAARFDRAHGTDKRTNQKVAWLTGRQTEYLRLLAQTGMLPPKARIHVHDSFGITAPRFHDSDDTHHYLKAEDRAQSPTKCGARVGTPTEWLAEGKGACPFGSYFSNAVGVSDSMAMLNSVCNPK